MIRALATAALDLLYPALCPVCEAPLGPGRRDPLCGACWEGIPRLEPPECECCGRPLLVFAALPDDDPRGGGDSARCGACCTTPPPFTYARAAGAYAGPLREALHAFKFRGRQALARPLADLLLERCGTMLPGVDALIPVPLAPDRERARGFNQARLITERVGAALGIPVRSGWLRRLRATAPQSELGAGERRANVRGAFEARPAVAGLHVVLVDDVLTTGATAAACATALREAGARVVGVLTVARVVGGAL